MLDQSVFDFIEVCNQQAVEQPVVRHRPDVPKGAHSTHRPDVPKGAHSTHRSDVPTGANSTHRPDVPTGAKCNSRVWSEKTMCPSPWLTEWHGVSRGVDSKYCPIVLMESVWLDRRTCPCSGV